MIKEENNFCTFYIVRHTESEGNAQRMLTGHLDVPLTEKGLIQAREVGKKLRNIHFDAAYSSDLLRAKQTAEAILLERKIAAQTSQLIKERSYGIHEGKKSEEYQQHMKGLYEELNKLSEEMRKNFQFPDGIESESNVIARMTTFLREVAMANPGKTVLVVTHGGILRYFLVHVGFAERRELQAGAIGNGAFIKLISDGVDFVIKEVEGVVKTPVE